MKLRKSQKLELIGALLASVALLIQVFVFTIFEHDANEADDAVLKEQITQIYYASLRQPRHNPKWEEIEEFYKGPNVIAISISSLVTFGMQCRPLRWFFLRWDLPPIL